MAVQLTETVDEAYEPNQSEVKEYAEWLGMDLEQDAAFFWIARAGLKEPLPKPWKPCQSEDGEIFYFNFETGESVWDHPCDEHHRKNYQLEKEKAKRLLATLHASLLESGSVRICVTSMGGNELAAFEIRHTEHSIQWLERKLNKRAGNALQLILPDGQALGEDDRKKQLCDILGISVKQVTHGAKKSDIAAPRCPECACPMEWQSSDGVYWQCNSVSHKSSCLEHSEPRSQKMDAHRWICQDCDAYLCSTCSAATRHARAHGSKEQKKNGKSRGPTELPPLKGCSLSKAKNRARSPAIWGLKAAAFEKVTNGTLDEQWT